MEELNTYTTQLMPHHMYERTALSLSNLLTGDLDPALRALFSPDTLSPEEHRMIKKAVGKTSATEEVITALGKTVVHPLFLIGFLLHARFPIASAKNLFKSLPNAIATGKSLDPITRFISTPKTIFRKHPELLEAMWGVSAKGHEFKATVSEQFHMGTEKFVKRVGRLPNSKESSIIAMLLDGADDVSTPHYQKIANALSNDKFGSFQATPLVKPLAQMDLAANVKAGIQEVVEHDRSILKNIFKQMKGATPEERKNVERIAKRMGLQGILGDEVDKYWVHKIRNFRNIFDDVPKTPEEYASIAEHTERVLSRSMLRRSSTPVMPSLSELDELGPGVVNPEYLAAMKRWAASHANRASAKVLAHVSTLRGDPEDQAKALAKFFQEDMGVSETSARAFADRTIAMKTQYPEQLKEFVDTNKNVFGGVLEYGIHRERDLSSYIAGVAPQVAWSTTMPGVKRTYGEVIAEYAKYKMAPGPHRDILVRDYIPALRGLKSFRSAETYNRMWFNDLRAKLKDTLQHPRVAAALGAVPGGKQATRWLVDKLDAGSLSIMDSGISGSLANWIYTGALGGNIGSALKNLSQSVLTPLPLLGPGAIHGGMSSLSRKMPLYFSELKKALKTFGGNLEEADDFATRKIFPEFKAQDTAPFTKFQDYASQDTKEWIRGVHGLLGKTKSFSMLPFMATERFNRLLSFEAGMHKALTNGMTRTEAAKFAGEVVHYTQFPGGVLGTPHGTLNWNPLFRQFTQFPMRMLDFMWSSTGFGLPAGKTPLRIMGTDLNLGTIGRAVAATSVAYPIAKMMGADISSSLLEGAVPTPSQPGTPFYPSPVVPPAVGMVGGLIHAIGTGDTSRLASQFTPLVPMGIAGSRAARNLLPHFADYKNREPDGKIRLYDKRGNYTGSFSMPQLMAKAAGIQLTSVAQEQAFVEYMSKQSKILREYRSEYMKALADNNVSKAQQIQTVYQKRYPQLGPLKVSGDDIKKMQERQDLTRVQRLLSSMPSEIQPLFQAAYAAVLGQNLPAFHQPPAQPEYPQMLQPGTAGAFYPGLPLR